MDEIRYIHAADLHLDTPFRGLAQNTAQGGRLARLLHEATFIALERLISCCEREKPDFLVLSGDIYNQEDHSVKAQLALRDGCLRLSRLGIPVFIAHGNHDPLSSRLMSVEWPDNVVIFGAEPETHPLLRDGAPLALIHGVSHGRPKEGRNLARLFRRDAGQDCFQLGVLHCAVQGQAAERYAPCTLEDLVATGLDAWALGHVHERCILSEQPFIAYPGNTQGLHINETGPRGCLIVTAAPHAGGWRCQAEFRALGPVQWEKLALDLENVDHLDEVERRLTDALTRLGEDAPPTCEAVIARVTLAGRTPLDALLRKAATADDLAERLQHLAGDTPGTWLKDLRVETRSLAEREELLRREDLLGETARLAREMRESPEALHALAGPALEPLFAHSRLRKALTPPDEEQLGALLDEAERLCLDLLEER
ncbi:MULTISPECIES: DNA repair exonuclease [unclassified Desulfovibrio]|uniref:metallophosphoesterase family protein n=1 Tax=unclassified Desulfovibrio TaxID=2593640 RepID=UPI0013EA2B8B|nr:MULTISPECIES: DNA repair exonuclease [unclassified Desulfovibrio]